MIYDITQPLFECTVFPGDPKPERKILMETKNGDICNLSAFTMCAHNGTHVDAPFHFIGDGKGIDRISLEKFIGPAYVASHEGDLTAEDAEKILEKAAAACRGAEKKILIKGIATVTEAAAEVFARAETDLVGNESQTVGPENAPAAVHYILLGKEVVLLEGIRLAGVPDGAYLLHCAPLNLSDGDGAPCRATLMTL